MTWLQTRVVLLAGIACLAGYVYAYGSGRAGAPIRSDAFSYYVYLPAWALHHDLSLQAVADDCCGGEFPAWTAITRWRVTHRWVDAHPIGEAILIAPFFAVAHALTRWTNLSPDGFTPYYQHGAGLAGLFYAVCGLWFLHRLLQRHYSLPVASATIAVLVFGTSLYHYATFDSTWSHAFSFALCSALLERLDRWPPAPPLPTTRSPMAAEVLVGVLSGLIVLVRHTNVVIPICFVGAAALRARRLPIVPAVVAALVVAPQLWLYHVATRHWVISAYGSLGFTFASPHLAGVLIGPRKGLFFYAPVLLGAVAGFTWLPPRLRAWRMPAAAVLILHTYLIASWWDWQFGASYGHRGFVDVYPVLAPGLAAALARAADAPALRRATTAAVLLLCALSLFQMLQYWHGVLPMSDVTWAQYRAAFLRPW